MPLCRRVSQRLAIAEGWAFPALWPSACPDHNPGGPARADSNDQA